MVEVWNRVEEYETLYSIQFENLIIDVLKANQWNGQIKPNKFASQSWTKIYPISNKTDDTIVKSTCCCIIVSI